MKLLPLITCLFIYWTKSSAQFLPVVDQQLIQDPNQEFDNLALIKPVGVFQNPEMELFTEGDILDSTYIWNRDIDEQSYELRYRNIYTYNPQGSRLTWLKSNRSGSHWLSTENRTYTYDGNNNLVYELSQRYQVVLGWYNYYQSTCTYNSNNDRLSRFTQEWSGNAWVNDSKLESTYDDNHHELTLLSINWNGIQWATNSLRTNSYDSNGLRIHQLIQSWNGSWRNHQQFYYTYDLSGLQETTLHQIWKTDHWENYFRLFYSYDDRGNVLSILQQKWDGIAWQDDSRNDSTYDTFDNLTVSHGQSFINNTWVNDYLYTLTYDEENNKVSEIYQNWQDGWIYLDSTHFYNTLLSAIKAPGYHDALTITPNPAQESIRIHSNTQPFESITISIYSQAGVKVMERKMDSLQEGTIDISKLPPGAYNIIVQNDQGIETKKFLKL